MALLAGRAGRKRLCRRPRRRSQAWAGCLLPKRACSIRGDLAAHPPAGAPPWMIALEIGGFSFSLSATKHYFIC
eukprot:scaffold326125_cov17-Prasinocladus_malaysianus.AAC.1